MAHLICVNHGRRVRFGKGWRLHRDGTPCEDVNNESIVVMSNSTHRVDTKKGKN